jgi:voltage-gated potassium channel
LETLKGFWEKLKIPLIMLFLAFVGGTMGYKLIFPDIPLRRLFFMTAITLTTVGYGDTLGVENHPVASWYTMGLMVVGMGFVLYGISFLTAFFVEGKLEEMLLTQSILRKVFRMKDHYVICGAGQTGIHVIRELDAAGVPFVVIDTDPQLRRVLRDEFPGCLVITGDSTSDAVLETAGLMEARGLVAALPMDKDNLFLTVTARMLNQNLSIVSKAVEISMRRKLTMAGANYVVSPNFIGGMRMASEILRPNVVSFLDRMLKSRDADVKRIEEVTVPRPSRMNGKSLGELNVHERTGIIVIAYLPPGTNPEFIYNPGRDLRIVEGGVLFFIGSADDKRSLLELIS